MYLCLYMCEGDKRMLYIIGKNIIQDFIFCYAYHMWHMSGIMEYN
jgi:hypothetical protein